MRHDETARERMTDTLTNRTDLEAGQEGEIRVPVTEEELQVGKRAVERGGVQVQTRVVETPVQEQVQLREENVTVERHPVNRPINPNDPNAFQEGEFEVREMGEEAVVAKQARVAEEIVVRKDVDQRTETVSDTVRRTDVDVQPVAANSRYAEFDTDWQSDFNTRYAGRGLDYSRYQPAYQYGHELANDSRYAGREWSAMEGDLQRDWNTRGHGSWSDVKDSVHYAWDRARNRGNVRRAA